MARVLYGVSMSLDGFVAGKNQSRENPLGEGGAQLHAWMRALRVWREGSGLEGGETNASSRVLAEDHDIRASIMGRNMFGGGPGPWGDDPWRGWWGDNPPFHHPVFVLTHHPRPPLEMDGGTTFTFVTDGIESALRQAQAAAGDGNISLGGGHTGAQYLRAGLIDEFHIHLVPVLLGEGVAFFELVKGASIRLEQVRAVEGPGVTHLAYRVLAGQA